MAALENIRKRGKLLAIVIGFALAAFILGDFINTGGGGSLPELADINGNKVVLTNDIVSNNNKPIAPDLASDLLLSETALIDGTGNHTTLSTEDATIFENSFNLGY